MKQKNRIQIFLFCVFFSLGSLVASVRSAEDINVSHQKVLATFMDLQKQGKISDRQALQHLFKVAHVASLSAVGLAQGSYGKKTVSAGYLKQLNRDIASLKKIIKKKRKHKENFDLEQQLAGSLNRLQKFLKKYRLQIEVVGHHADVRADWGDMFDLVNKGQDILSMLPSKGIEQPGLKGLKVLIRKMERVLDKTDEYEDRLHADWVDLKLANYVFKIELVRLRNAAIFHPLYRGTSMKSCYPR